MPTYPCFTAFIIRLYLHQLVQRRRTASGRLMADWDL